MDFAAYRQLDATALAQLVARREVSASDLLDTALARLAEVEPKLNAISLLTEQYGRERARHDLSGPLAGVPFLLKDLNQHVAGLPTSAGTAALRSAPAATNATVVDRWLEAGLVFIGKTTVPEFGSKPVTDSAAFGVTRNPWDLSRTPGGSSGGAAAAVSAGVVPVAGASDGGGSIRVPAACCGLVGLKAGRGLIPSGPLNGELLHGAATEGVVSRSIRDTALMLDILTTPHDDAAPYRVAKPDRPYVDLAAEEPPKLRIGYTATSPFGTPVDTQAVAAVEDAAQLLSSLGHHVESASPALDGDELFDDFFTVFFTRTAAAIADACQRGARARDFDLGIRLAAASSRAKSSVRFHQCLANWNTHTRALAESHAQYDLLLTPTLGAPPIRIGEFDPSPLVARLGEWGVRLGLGSAMFDSKLGRKATREALAAFPFTPLANVTGRPAISIPTYWTPSGLPLGTQLVGQTGSEPLLLQVGAQIEAARPWMHRVPPL